MLEARAHNQLKNLLRGEFVAWPHNLTLSRLVARSLRRRDHTLIELDLASQDCWWIGLLIPLSLESTSPVLLLSANKRSRFLNIELPRLQKGGVKLAFWEGLDPPPGGQVWLLDHQGLIHAYQEGFLRSRQLIIPEAEHLTYGLREAMAIEIRPHDWDILRRAYPSASSSIMQLYERLTRRLFSNAARLDAQLRIDWSEIVPFKDLLGLLSPLPHPWPVLLETDNQSWAGWAELNHKMFNWVWRLKPLEPLQQLDGLLVDQPTLLINKSRANRLFLSELESVSFLPDVKVKLGGPNFQEPIRLFAPLRQPLPNTEIFANHLLEQCRRLILGRAGITILLLDDLQLRCKLTSQLAAEFGRRVLHETTAPEPNGVICCRCSWWINHYEQLPSPEQLIVALLPFASLESPLTAARVEALKNQGGDWFRDLLLPEALTIFQQAVVPIRSNQARLAILDGRLRARSWGEEFFRILEPWDSLQRLLPS